MAENSNIKSLKNIIFLSSPNIENNNINIFNKYELLNDFYSSNFLEDKISHKIKLNEIISDLKDKFIFKSSGYLINNITKNCENEFFSLKVETNLRFKITINNNFNFDNDEFFENLKNIHNTNLNSPDSSRANVNFYEINTFNSKKICLIKNSLNQISIFSQFYFHKNSEENKINLNPFEDFFTENKKNKKKEEAHFIISYIKDSKVYEFKTTDFIPFAPFEKFRLDKNTILSDVKVLSCKTTNHEIKLKDIIKKNFICPEICMESEKNSICRTAYENGVIPNTGGNFIISKKKENLTLYGSELPKIGLDYMITDLKLGYEEDFKKFSQQANTLLFKNYMVKIEVNSTLNEDDSFLFYKKDLIKEKKNLINEKIYIILNAKIICDNTQETSHDLEQSEKREINNSKIFILINKF